MGLGTATCHGFTKRLFDPKKPPNSVQILYEFWANYEIFLKHCNDLSLWGDAV